MDIVTAITQFAWIVWIALAAVFLVVEMLTLDFLFLMFGIASLAGLVSALTGAPLWLQVVIVAVVAALLLLLIRPPLLRRLRRGEDPPPTNVAALIGMSGRVVATIDATGGQVRLANGEIWSARADAASVLEPGTEVSVDRVAGAHVHVIRRTEGLPV